MFRPKLFTTIQNYSRQQFFADLLAGVVVGVVALPLAIAFGIASGVSPEKGLLTAIVAGFLISAFGGSRVQIGGPTGAFIVIVYGIVQKYGTDGLTVVTLMAGVMLIAFGIFKLGNVIKFVPRSVIVGFTSGIAVIIFSSQIKDLFGLHVPQLPSEFIQKWVAYLGAMGSWNLASAAVAGATILVITLWPKAVGQLSMRVPGPIVALVALTAVVTIFHLPVETIGSRFGGLPRSLPAPRIPAIHFEMIKHLLQPAFTVALLCAVESLLSAVVSDGMIGGKHRSNTELIGQGIANLASALFGGIPATGAIARTATNVKNGGRTPVAGIVHALTLLLILFFFGQWAKLIPMACLAGILTVVAYHMSEWRSFSSLLKGPKSDISVLIVTFLLTVLVDLTVAIEVGMVLSAFLFINRMASVTKMRLVNEAFEERRRGEMPSVAYPLPEGVDLYEVSGPLFFGVAQEFEETMRIVSRKPKVRILWLRHVPAMDATGLYALESIYHDCSRMRVDLILAGVHSQPLKLLKKSGLYDAVGEKSIVGNMEEAVARARQLLAAS